jgi:hypothetical protein
MLKRWRMFIHSYGAQCYPISSKMSAGPSIVMGGNQIMKCRICGKAITKYTFIKYGMLCPDCAKGKKASISTVIVKK